MIGRASADAVAWIGDATPRIASGKPAGNDGGKSELLHFLHFFFRALCGVRRPAVEPSIRSDRTNAVLRGLIPVAVNGRPLAGIRLRCASAASAHRVRQAPLHPRMWSAAHLGRGGSPSRRRPRARPTRSSPMPPSGPMINITDSAPSSPTAASGSVADSCRTSTTEVVAAALTCAASSRVDQSDVTGGT